MGVVLPLKKNIPPLDDIAPIGAEIVSWLGKDYGIGTQISIRWRGATNSLATVQHQLWLGHGRFHDVLSLLVIYLVFQPYFVKRLRMSYGKYT